MGKQNFRAYYNDDTPERKKIRELRQELCALYRKETANDYPEDKITGKAKIDGKEVKIAVPLLCPSELAGFASCFDVDQIEPHAPRLYSYPCAVWVDVCEWLLENMSAKRWRQLADDPDALDTLADRYRDSMEDSDEITGNASGSYFCSTWKAELALFGNDETWEEARDELEATDDRTPEEKDVFCRVLWLPRVLPYALRELRKAICEATGRPTPDDAADEDDAEEETQDEEATA